VSGNERYVTNADLGGTTGHGAIEHDDERVVFHHQWEARVLAMTVAAGASGKWTLDMSRRYRETLPDYADLSYYEIWEAGLERLLVDRGLVTADELAAGHALVKPLEGIRVLKADRVAAGMRSGSSTERQVSALPRFAVGDLVRARDDRVDHHTRLPSYAAGKIGRIERLHGPHVFADTHAHDLGEQPAWLYAVVFDAAELWDDAAPRPDAAPRQSVSIDAWESYLEPVDERDT